MGFTTSLYKAHHSAFGEEALPKKLKGWGYLGFLVECEENFCD
jgi:hypothetical protein